MRASDRKNQDGDQGLTTVRQIMTTELITVDPSTTLIAAAGAMSAGHAGSVLVVQHGSLVGIFTERDMLRAMAQSSKADAARVSSVSKWMTRDPLTVAPDTPVGEALDQMLSGGFRHLPVMEADTVVGVISMRDLAKSISKE
jgi:CBS domain-containing protein